MDALHDPSPGRLLTLPDAPHAVLSIRAKAMLFHDARSVDLIERVERIARSDATVLLIGETGTGKELIARHVHAASGRRGPFLAVNCGAFSENLIDAELFGHESGAYTGAQGARAGWFEAAHGGTLFLDEIGDLPQPLQVKLLRVLQERQVVRLGSRKSIGVDVRLVAATNIDLRQAVDAQHFRADLYYRLSVATVELPPLRERRGDILPLARHFMKVHGPRLNLPDVTLSPGAEDALQHYLWPGNIRELENVIHFALIVCRHGEIREGDLKLVPGVSPLWRPNAPAAGTHAPDAPASAGTTRPDAHPDPAAHVAAVPVAAPVPVTPPEPPEPSALDRFVQAVEGLLDERCSALFQLAEAELVRQAFERSGENQVRAARLLGVTRNTMRTLLKRHGLLASAGAGGDAETGLEAEPLGETACDGEGDSEGDGDGGPLTATTASAGAPARYVQRAH